jgi:hypothetical protein
LKSNAFSLLPLGNIKSKSIRSNSNSNNNTPAVVPFDKSDWATIDKARVIEEAREKGMSETRIFSRTNINSMILRHVILYEYDKEDKEQDDNDDDENIDIDNNYDYYYC